MNQTAHPSAIPPDYMAYKRTPIFDQNSVPKGLLCEHHTKLGVWALIHVLEGQLRYQIPEINHDQLLSSSTAPGVVVPTQKHQVELVGAVRFYVEFFAQPNQQVTQPSTGL